MTNVPFRGKRISSKVTVTGISKKEVSKKSSRPVERETMIILTIFSASEINVTKIHREIQDEIFSNIPCF